MTRLRKRWMLLLALTLSVLLFGQWRRLRAARGELDSRRSAYESLLQDGRGVLRLRALQETASMHERPATDLLARVNQILTNTGIPSDRFGSLNPEGDLAWSGGDSGLRKQSSRLHLRQLLVSDLGRFLAAWSEEQELWSVESIEMTHARSTDNASLYDARILLTALYHARSTRPDARGGS